MNVIRDTELQQILDSGKPVEILDIRPRRQFERAHIEGAHWIPSAAVSPETILLSRELLPTEPLYLVSESGALAQLSACELERQGVDNLFVLGGGMHAWQNDGLPVMSEDAFATAAAH